MSISSVVISDGNLLRAFMIESMLFNFSLDCRAPSNKSNMAKAVRKITFIPEMRQETVFLASLPAVVLMKAETKVVIERTKKKDKNCLQVCHSSCEQRPHLNCSISQRLLQNLLILSLLLIYNNILVLILLSIQQANNNRCVGTEAIKHSTPW